MRHLLLAAVALGATAPLSLPIAPAFAQTASPAIAKAVADPRRKAENRARDRYRHPAETLAFFGVKPNQTVVEVLPGGGWYSEILAPLLHDQGRYIAAVPAGGRAGFSRFTAADPARFGKVTVTEFAPGKAPIAPDGSADVVLTFRNVHNFLMGEDATPAAAFAAFFRALKPGGVLGVVDHRLPEGRDSALEKKSGYLKRSTVVRLAEQAGFRLAGESEVNANPKDTADWPDGVWTLPPTYQLKDKDRARYAAIGESDRMTLRFVKPAR